MSIKFDELSVKLSIRIDTPSTSLHNQFTITRIQYPLLFIVKSCETDCKIETIFVVWKGILKCESFVSDSLHYIVILSIDQHTSFLVRIC